MANRTKNIQEEIRRLIKVAVDQDIITPNEVEEYIEDNGQERPHRMTTIKILKENGVEFVAGYYMNTKKIWADSK